MMRFNYSRISIVKKSRSKNSENACYHSVSECFVFRYAIQNAKVKIHRTIVLPFVLYGCETRSLTLRTKRRLMFENMVLRGIFGPKRDTVTGEWRELYNEPNDLQYHQILFRRPKQEEQAKPGM